MSVCTIAMPIGTHPDTHLVTSRVSVEWRTIPFLFGGFVSVVLQKFEHTRTSLASCKIITHYFYFLLLFAGLLLLLFDLTLLFLLLFSDLLSLFADLLLLFADLIPLFPDLLPLLINLLPLFVDFLTLFNGYFSLCSDFPPLFVLRLQLGGKVFEKVYQLPLL